MNILIVKPDKMQAAGRKLFTIYEVFVFSSL